MYSNFIGDADNVRKGKEVDKKILKERGESIYGGKICKMCAKFMAEFNIRHISSFANK